MRDRRASIPGFAATLPLVLLLLSGCAVATQQVPIGSVVRLHLDTPEGYGRPVTGLFRGATRDSLLVQRDSLGATSAVSRAQILALEVHRRGTARTIGALIGATAGAGAATAAVGEDRKRCEHLLGNFCGLFFEVRFLRALEFYAAGVGLGAVAGSLIGKAIPVTYWRRVPLGDLRVVLSPLPAGRLGLGAAFSF
jgi:hypothetical protein